MTVPDADRVLGSLFGTALGDMLGSPNEGRNHTPVPIGRFDRRLARVTDDTQLTLVIADALIAGNGEIHGDDLARRLVRWLPTAVGIGTATRDAVRRLEAGEPWDSAGEPSAGNGAAMRAAPIGLVHTDQHNIRRDARTATVPTHRDPTAVLSATIVAWAAGFLARHDGPVGADPFVAAITASTDRLDDPVLAARGPREGRPVTLLGEIEAATRQTKRNPQDWFHDHYSGAFVVESFPAAVWCFLHGDGDPEETIRAAVEHARDADTVGAMAGALAGAHTGASSLPPEWVAWIPSEVRASIETAAEGLLRVADHVARLSPPHEPIPVPSPTAGWDKIWRLALTYNGYTRHGVESVGTMANRAAARWRRDRSLPGALADARCCLFFEQRRYRHVGTDPAGADDTYVRALVRHIGDLAGGSVPGPADDLP
jgi:ADP-ribosylglycohydrolase